MSDQGAIAFHSQTMVECGICDSTFNVSWFCKNCAGSLCDTCKQNHQRASLFRKHIVVQRTMEVLRLHGPAKIAEICQLHATKEISTYCNDCKVPCCVLCLSDKHQRHGFSPIEDKYLQAEKNLDQYARELKTNLKPTLNTMTEIIKRNKDEIDVCVKTVKEDINTFRFTLKQKVDGACDLLLQELDQSKIDFRSIEIDLDSCTQRLDKLISNIENKIRKGELDIIEYSPPNPTSLIPDLSLPIMKLPRFVPGLDLIGLIQNKIGSIEFKEHITSDEREKNVSSTLILQGSKEEQFHSAKCIDKSCIDIRKIKSFNSMIGACSLTVADINSAWVMTFSSDTLYLYDNNGDMVRSVNVKNGKGINDMVITKSGEMIVACGDNKVRHVSVGGVVSTLVDTTPFGAEGLCLTEKEDVVVCMGGQGVRNHLAIYSLNGCSKLREIRGMDGQGKQNITSPYHVILNEKDLCVVNWYSNVVCVDDNDSVRWVYDGEKAELYLSFNPRDICVDEYHNMLISDINNHCVHYIDREGKLIKIILTEEHTGLRYHWSICVLDDTRQVWIGNSMGEVVIAKYLK